MKDRERIGLSKSVALGVSLMLAGGAPVSAQEADPSFQPDPSQTLGRSFIEEQIDSDTPVWRTSVMSDKSIVVCFSQEEPEQIDFDLDEIPEFLVVTEADCGQIHPTGELEIFPNTSRAIPIAGNAETIDLTFLSEGDPYPQIFETFEDRTEVYQ